MYTNQDLSKAIEAGVFSEESVREFQQLIDSTQSCRSVDEENIKLVGGFNDLFIVIACLLLLFSTQWAVKALAGIESIALLVFSVVAWGLAEYFVRKRKMALPAIVLLAAFVGGVFSAISELFASSGGSAYMFAAGGSSIAAFLHWRRFRVPITVAVGVAVTITFVVLAFIYFFPNGNYLITLILLCFGIVTFCLAMYWDAADTARMTSKSDVAFWLHLLSALMVIHPLFSSLGVLEGNQSIWIMSAVIILYLVMTVVSVVIDRRAFMVSSLVYVLYALYNVLETIGVIGYSLGLTGLIMGGSLLLLSAYWSKARVKLVNVFPLKIQQIIPSIDESSERSKNIVRND